MKIRNKPMNTPDTEWDIVREAHTFLPVDLEGREDFLQSLEQFISSRDTYWKEMVEAVGSIQCENGYALAIKHFEKRMQAGQSAREAIDGMKKIHRQKKALTSQSGNPTEEEDEDWDTCMKCKKVWEHCYCNSTPITNKDN